MTDAFELGLSALRAGALGEARRWLEAARRQDPWNASAALALGSVLIRQNDPAAVSLHQRILAGGTLNEALCGLAASLRMTGAHDEAARARGRALSLFSVSRSANQEAALDEYCRAAQIGGWCALAPGGRLTVVILDAQLHGDIHITLDGIPFATMTGESRFELDLPDRWTAHASLGVHAPRQILGHPISLADIVRVEGLADTADGDLHGWAWSPHDPDYDPVLTIHSAGIPVCEAVTAHAPALDIRHWRPLARPRKFRIPAEMLKHVGGPIEIVARDGRNLYGSPLDPSAWRDSAIFAARQSIARPQTGKRKVANRPSAISAPRTPMLPMPASLQGPAPSGGDVPGDCVIVVPVYGATEMTLRCLDSVLADLPGWASVVAVNDASEDAVLVRALDALAAANQLVVLHHKTNAGFPTAVNTGLAFAGGRDVVLLNSDTLVPPGWLHRLRDAAYSCADIGTVTPMSNDGTLVNYPDTAFANPIPDLEETCRLDRFASQADTAVTVELPTAIGFCMFIKRDCLRDTGFLRADIFAQGYGEENDFCMRARHLGWRHAAAPHVFVAHVGGQSFGGARAYLRSRNLRILNELHTGYDALIAQFTRTDPLAAARRAIDRVRWCAGRDSRPAVLLITHGRRGGIQRRVRERAEALRTSGMRPLCLWPVQGRVSGRDCVLGDGPEGGTPNLRYMVESELQAAADLLRGDNIVRIEVHSLIGHDHNVIGLAEMLGVPYDMVLHDFASFCPRITLVTGENRFCGEPEIAECERCVGAYGNNIEEDVSVGYLRARSSVQLAAAASVIVPSKDAAQRIARHFRGIEPRVAPWENDRAIKAPALPTPAQRQRRVCLVGAIGREKGFDVLLGCAHDALSRELPLEFVVAGYTCDDGRLLKLGNVQITGEYDESEAVDLIRRQRACCAFIPSIWPETWSYTLSLAWQAGLYAFAFDLGAPAERIRARGWGGLLPLGASPGAINDAFMTLRQKEALLF
jgi:GT2 family glycosyltransferase